MLGKMNDSTTASSAGGVRESDSGEYELCMLNKKKKNKVICSEGFMPCDPVK